jgi:GT2 family glycosyltransferase
MDSTTQPEGAGTRREDVISLYNFMLRRDPESDQVITPRLKHSIDTIFTDMAASKEFANNVVRPVLSKTAPVSPPYRGSGRLLDLLGWAATQLPLSPDSRSRISEAETWEEVDLALALDPAVIAAVPALQEAEARRPLERRALMQESSLVVDPVYVTPEGLCFISGWVDSDESVAIHDLGLYRGGEALGLTTAVARCRRADVEASFPAASPNMRGFWAVLKLERPLLSKSKLEVRASADKKRCGLAGSVVNVNERRLRDLALEHLGRAQYYNEPTAEAFFQLDNGVGRALIGLNESIVSRFLEGGYRMQFGPRRAHYAGSIIVCIYGKPEYLTLQTSLFSQSPGYENYEFIYVSNSPELGETLAKDAAIASLVYGVSITLIIMAGNAGFGAANNVAAAAASSERLLLVNPDVLPREREWPRLHSELVGNLPAEQTRLFGTTLYYDDGSLMHGGMYIVVDGGFVPRDEQMVRRDFLRVEHYGKGAPADAAVYRKARAVPAVTGAFVSIDRAWFEQLGGFSRQYIFGHYEDVDLCLRSLQAGTPAWLHDLPFWHLESKGSTFESAHVGGRLVNRWQVTSSWLELVKTDLNGPRPARFS